MQNLLNKGSTARKFFSTLVMTSLVVPGILLQVPEAKALGTLATTVISNQATAKYKDAGGNSYTSTSNLVTTTISQVFGVNLVLSSTNLTSDANAQSNPGQSQNATPGTIVYYPYTLTNTGNAPETYFITTTVGSATAASTGPLTTALKAAIASTKKVFLDVNGNGTIDVGDTEILQTTPGVTNVTPSVPADGSIKLIVQYQIPVTAVATDVVLVDIQADSEHDGVGALPVATVPTTGFDQWNYNKTTIVNNGVVSVVKSVDKASADPSITGTNSDLTYSFNIGNTGNKSVDNIVVVDAIPTNTAFVVGSQTPAAGGGAFTYYASTDGSGVPITPTGAAGAVDTAIKSIKYTLGDNTQNNGNELPPSNNRTMSFQVRVNIGAPAVTIPNLAAFTYDPDGTDAVHTSTPSADTNTVVTNINKKAGALVSFATSGRFSSQTTTGSDGGTAVPGTPDDTSVQASAPAGTYVYYKNVVTNNGNAADTFNLTVPSNSFPTGSTVTFLALTDPTTPTNNTSPILDTNSDGTVDTGTIAAGASLTIVTRVFVPANAAAGGTVTVNAASTNGGTAFSATPGQSLSDTTRDTLTAVIQPSVKLLNIVNGTPVDNTVVAPTIGQTFTEVAPGATVSYPLNINNGGSTSDTFNLAGSVSGIAGSIVTFYPINVSTTIATGSPASLGDTSITLTSSTGINPGDKIVVNGQTLTVASAASGLVTFSSGEKLAAAAGAGTTVVVPATSAITSSSLIAAGGNQNVLAVVSVPATTLPNGAGSALTFTATSTNNVSKADTEPDVLVVPSFRNYNLVNNRTGSAPAGGVLFYDHTITNNGNVNEAFTITIPADVPGGMSYQLIDSSGIPSALAINVATLTPGSTYNFKLKVTVPAGLPATTVDSKVITAHETGSLAATDQTNTDSTTVVSGFISLVKSAITYPAFVGVLPVDPGAAPAVRVYPQVGGVAVNATGSTAKPNEIIEYTINYTNIGTQSALESVIIDAIPSNTTYVPGSLFIAATQTTDAKETGVGSDAGDFNVTNLGAVTLNIGNGAQGDLGGTVPQAASGSVKFRVRVN